MKRIRYLGQWTLYIAMDRACAWSGHRLRCYNNPMWLSRFWGRVSDFRAYDKDPR